MISNHDHGAVLRPGFRRTAPEPPDELERLDIVETARHIVDAYLSGASLVLD